MEKQFFQPEDHPKNAVSVDGQAVREPLKNNWASKLSTP